jgi:hypothetical protein
MSHYAARMARLARFAPLTGVAFALLIPAGFASGVGAPPTDATAVRDFFIHNGSASQISDNLWILGFAFLLFFAGSLHAALRSSRSLATLLVAGAALMAAGGGVYFGFDFTVSSSAQSLSPDAAQAINALAVNLVFPLSMGGAVFGISTGLAIWCTHALPKWLGAVVFVIGLVLASPLVLFGLLLLAVWSLITAILLIRRGPLTASAA